MPLAPQGINVTLWIGGKMGRKQLVGGSAFFSTIAFLLPNHLGAQSCEEFSVNFAKEIQLADSIKLTVDLPPTVAAYNLRHPQRAGPNCFNAALMAAGLNNFPRYAWGSEITFWTQSPLCHPVEVKKDALRTGDIGLVGDVDDDPMYKKAHAFVRVGDRHVFDKHNKGTTIPWQIRPFDQDFLSQWLPKDHNRPECLGAIGEPSGCTRWINYFRCISLERYLEQNTAAVPEAYRKLAKDLKELELKESRRTAEKKPEKVKYSSSDSLQDEIWRIRREARKRLAGSEVSEVERVLWGGMIEALESLDHQHNMLLF